MKKKLFLFLSAFLAFSALPRSTNNIQTKAAENMPVAVMTVWNTNTTIPSTTTTTSTTTITTTTENTDEYVYRFWFTLQPNKMTYLVGEELDTSGSLIAVAKDDADGNVVSYYHQSMDSSMFRLEYDEFTEVGEYPILIYRQKTNEHILTLAVDVIERELEENETAVKIIGKIADVTDDSVTFEHDGTFKIENAELAEELKANIGNDVKINFICYNKDTIRSINYMYVSDTPKEIKANLTGDANCDGEVNIADATAITQHLGNKDKYGLSEQGLANADCYNIGDGVTGLDAIEIQKFEAKIIQYFERPDPETTKPVSTATTINTQATTNTVTTAVKTTVATTVDDSEDTTETTIAVTTTANTTTTEYIVSTPRELFEDAQYGAYTEKYTATISVVDSETGEPVDDVQIKFKEKYYGFSDREDNTFGTWNTSDANPCIIEFDYHSKATINFKHEFIFENIPDGYSCPYIGDMFTTNSVYTEDVYKVDHDAKTITVTLKLAPIK